MSFSLDSLKDSLTKMDTIIQKENRIWIEDLGLPENFDSRTHYIYLPMHMKENFQDQVFPDFLRFSETVPFDQMFVVDKYMIPSENQWGEHFK